MRSTTRVLAAASISALTLWALAVAPNATGQTAAPTAESAPDPHVDREACDITGTMNDDVLTSDGKGDVICGLGGDDVLEGKGGEDVLKGGPGNDDLRGGDGDDDLYGGIDEDLCRQHDGQGKKTSCEWPNPLLECPVKRGETVYDDFGDDRGDHAHEGNDITAKKGAPVIATFRGKTENLTADGAGKYVKLTRADGSFTYGMHLDKYAKERKVNPGDTIGYVGSSGNAGSINHLHFEWHPGGGRAVDPFPYLSKLCNDEKDRAPIVAGPTAD